MKKVLLLAAAIAMLAAPASAQKLSLWADDAMNSCQVTTPGPYVPFNLYVWVEPGPDGAFAVEYMLNAPLGHFSTTNVKNTFVSAAALGSWIGSPGISAGFLSCQLGPVWVINLTMMAPNTIPAYYTLSPNADTGFLGIAICPDPRPMVDGTVMNDFGFNADCVIGTKESSWGAIKSLY